MVQHSDSQSVLPRSISLHTGHLQPNDDDDFYCYIGKRPQLEGKTENGGICAKKRIRVKAVVLMARQLPAKEIALK